MPFKYSRHKCPNVKFWWPPLHHICDSDVEASDTLQAGLRIPAGPESFWMAITVITLIYWPHWQPQFCGMRQIDRTLLLLLGYCCFVCACENL